jgi:hypothetical protein
MKKVFHTFQHLFTPHHTNNHRARILHAEVLLFVIAIIGAVTFAFRTAVYVYPSILGFATNITINDLLSDTNAKRSENGLGTLVLNSKLNQAAQNKANDMFAHSYWAHNSPQGSTPWDFIVGAGYSYSYAGENLARDFQNSDSVVQAWMDSPSHRENILRKEYSEIGFAIVNGILDGQETTLVVQMFGTPKESPIEVSATEPKEIKTVVPNSQPAVGEIREMDMEPITEIEKTNQASIVKAKYDYRFFIRSFAMFIIGVLMTILVIDGVLIYKRKTVRIAGHNLAHFIFFIAVIGVILISTQGSIL